MFFYSAPLDQQSRVATLFPDQENNLNLGKHISCQDIDMLLSEKCKYFYIGFIKTHSFFISWLEHTESNLI